MCRKEITCSVLCAYSLHLHPRVKMYSGTIGMCACVWVCVCVCVCVYPLTYCIIPYRSLKRNGAIKRERVLIPPPLVHSHTHTHTHTLSLYRSFLLPHLDLHTHRHTHVQFYSLKIKGPLCGFLCVLLSRAALYFSPVFHFVPLF